MLSKDDYEHSILVRVDLKDTNKLITNLNKYPIKSVTEKKHTLEEFFVKDIGGEE